MKYKLQEDQHSPDSLASSGAKKIETKNNHLLDKQQEELLKAQNFLERERIRFDRLMEFLNTKIPVAMNYQQTELLIIQEQEYQKKLQQQIIAKLRGPDNYLQQKMARIFDKTFFADLSY